MAKKRVYDLAKEYGMTGQDLAAKLRDLGFAQIKSHMTALSDFEVMEIQGRLEAYGIVGESSQKSASALSGGLVVKRKKKKKPAEPPVAEDAPAEAPETPPIEAEPEAETPAEEPIAAEAAPAAPAEEAPVDPVESAEPAVEAEPEPEPQPAPAEPAVEEPEPVVAEEPTPAVEEPEPAPAAEAPAVEPEPVEPVQAEPEPAPEPEPVADAPSEPLVAETPEEAVEPEVAAAAAEATDAEMAAEGEEVETDESGVKVVRPSDKRRQAKVVGFIDLSQIQTTPKKPESRRLRSSDDVAPNVMPTLGRSKSQAFTRGDQASRGRLTASQLREREQQRVRRRFPPGASRQQKDRPRRQQPTTIGSPYSGQSVKIDEPITVKKLSESIAVKTNDMLKTSWQHLGFGAVQINSPLDAETAVLLAAEYEVELEVVREVAAEEQLVSDLDEKRASVGEEDLVKRPPTVAFLGHVDHGKTTLIDTIRRSTITEGESGGITQHIGAYQVTTAKGHTLTVIDTPGHAAFTSMRARGASAVDVVVLVIAADDGVMPQTEEALNHAKAAGTPIVVALNKMDKPDANVEKVRTQLSGLGLNPEDWGGETAMLPVSALKGDGVDELLERVFLEGEVLELDSHPVGAARGVVLEAEIQQGKGKVAHLLVQDGCLKRGDVILAGEGYGKVRSIHNDRGKQIQDAGPSCPVEVTGLNELPTVGDTFYVVPTLDQAQEVAEERSRTNRQISQIERRKVSQENILDAVASQYRTSINLILKTDVAGSAEVLKHQLSEFVHDEVEVKVLHSGVGQVVESDVDLAVTSNALVLAFHVGTNSKARAAAERHGVEIRNYSVIYELLDDVRQMMEGSLSPEVSEEITGHIEIRRLFKSSKVGNIAGCYVLDGKVRRDHRVRLMRDGKVVFTGAMASLRREKDDAKEVREGFECGVVLKNYNDIKEGDIIEAFKMVESKRTIDLGAGSKD